MIKWPSNLYTKVQRRWCGHLLTGGTDDVGLKVDQELSIISRANCYVAIGAVLWGEAEVMTAPTPPCFKRRKMRKYGVLSYMGVIKISFCVINKEIHAW